MGENTYLTTDFYVKGYVLSHEGCVGRHKVVALANAIGKRKAIHIIASGDTTV